MRPNEKLIQRMVQFVFKELKGQSMVTFKEKEETVYRRACDLIMKEYRNEAALDEEVNRMMDDLERQNPGQFQRFKMFPLLKKKLAKEKGIVL